MPRPSEILEPIGVTGQPCIHPDVLDTRIGDLAATDTKRLADAKRVSRPMLYSVKVLCSDALALCLDA